MEFDFIKVVLPGFLKSKGLNVSRIQMVLYYLDAVIKKESKRNHGFISDESNVDHPSTVCAHCMSELKVPSTWDWNIYFESIDFQNLPDIQTTRSEIFDCGLNIMIEAVENIEIDNTWNVRITRFNDPFPLVIYSGKEQELMDEYYRLDKKYEDIRSEEMDAELTRYFAEGLGPSSDAQSDEE